MWEWFFLFYWVWWVSRCLRWLTMRPRPIVWYRMWRLLWSICRRTTSRYGWRGVDDRWRRRNNVRNYRRRWRIHRNRRRRWVLHRTSRRVLYGGRRDRPFYLIRSWTNTYRRGLFLHTPCWVTRTHNPRRPSSRYRGGNWSKCRRGWRVPWRIVWRRRVFRWNYRRGIDWRTVWRDCRWRYYRRNRWIVIRRRYFGGRNHRNCIWTKNFTPRNKNRNGTDKKCIKN